MRKSEFKQNQNTRMSTSIKNRSFRNVNTMKCLLALNEDIYS